MSNNPQKTINSNAKYNIYTNREINIGLKTFANRNISKKEAKCISNGNLQCRKKTSAGITMTIRMLNRTNIQF